MGRPSVHQKSPEQAKAKATMKKKPIKVVYISNPMRVTTSAAQFRGLVQKLTGRDSNVADMAIACSPTGGPPSADCGGVTPRDLSSASDALGPCKGAVAAPFEMFDDGFSAQMLEDLSGLPPWPPLCCESSVGGFWRLGQV
ncbi:VQ motif [Musa troglodytarum]|uniref:VQ motif n=1 Tax=Musa troglodytarum TaxID=320322 RepID=A0A9E7EVQ4_9LILI|nr:VQ motif [Musa troglodytarum]